MKIRTLEDLTGRLDEALAWRRRELTNIRAMISEARGHQLDLHLRAGIALLYAHWEGYIKNAAEAYVEFVSRKRLRLHEMTPNFAALAIRTHLHAMRESNRVTFGVRVVSMLRDQALAPTHLSEDCVSTKSNLTSTVLRDIVDALGLDYSRYELRAKLIDESLVKARNEIAHGEMVFVDEDKFTAVSTRVEEMMEWFKTDVENAAAQKTFRNSA